MALAKLPHSRFVATICILTALYWAALFIATHVPTPRPPGSIPRRSIDKSAHLVAFAGLALLLCATGTALGIPAGRLYLLVLVTIAAYGIVDELTQRLVPTRSSDWRDWAADLAGGLLGVVAFAVLAKLVLAPRRQQAVDNA